MIFEQPSIYCSKRIIERCEMDHEVKSVRDLLALFARAWREASGYFKSIEVWLMFAMAGALVGGVFLAFMGEPASLLAFGVVIAYFTARPILHVRGILRWPFF
jgi:hypothetical protein